MATESGAFVDYYEVLGIPATADDERIKHAITTERRTWVKRQSAADPRRRAEAEERVRHIDEAERVLLNSSEREAFNRRKATHRDDAPPPAAEGEWLERAQQYLEQGNAHFANYAAREATSKAGHSHEAWAVRARSSLLLGRTSDAVFEFNEAIRLEPMRADYQFDLGSVHEAAEQWSQAMACYENAARLDPSEPVYRVAIASVFLQHDQPEQALTIMEEIVREHPDDEHFQYYLAIALSEVAAQKLTLLRDGTRMITTPAQVEVVKNYMGRAGTLKFSDRELRAMIDSNYQLALDAERIHWRVPGVAMVAGLAAVGGCRATAIALLVIIGGIWISLAIAFAANPAIGVLLLAGFGFLVYKTARIPGWKQNRINVKDFIVREP